jgi:hypothetical protein
MKKIVLMFLLVVAGTAACSAQETSVVFHPGDPIHVLVNFKTAPPTLEGAVFSFNLLGNPDKQQQMLTTSFQGNQVKKITDTQFELTGTVAANSASGTYRLNWINVTIKTIGKQYNEGSDFKDLTIAVLNPEHPEFPLIENVQLAPRS